MMPEFEKLKRYDLCNRLDEGLLQSEMVEKDDGEYVKADDAKKAFALHKDYCEKINSSYYEDWKKMFESYVPVKEENERLKKENAYLRMLAARALSRIYKMRYLLAWINHPFEKGRKKERYEKWIDKFIDLYRQAKNEFLNYKWGENEPQN